ncbi:heparinase II/III family protein [Paracoccaceae bacterium]|nr:heparinase II/III family protein [Paracoccaceae bacterium]
MIFTRILRNYLLKIGNAFYARTAKNFAQAEQFISTPGPLSIGNTLVADKICEGEFFIFGNTVQLEDKVIWDHSIKNVENYEDLHGFTWLDDLAARGDKAAIEIAQKWIFSWIEKYGSGSGAGWTPNLTGRRLIRLIHHEEIILRDLSEKKINIYFRFIYKQANFLSKRFYKTHEINMNFEAIVGLIYCGLYVEGFDSFITVATEYLSRECRDKIDEDGGILSRNPEELLEIFTYLVWVAHGLHDADWTPSQAHIEAINRIAPTLRHLRHINGILCRFNGSLGKYSGELDRYLFLSGNKKKTTKILKMGYARLEGGRTSIIQDAGSLPDLFQSNLAHASVLGFELTHGRQPLIVNCGSGANFGRDWCKAGRATQSHSTFCVKGQSSAKLTRSLSYNSKLTEFLSQGPTEVVINKSKVRGGTELIVSHDAYASKFAVNLERKLELSDNGEILIGNDQIAMLSTRDRSKEISFDNLEYEVRFQFHPEVTVQILDNDMVKINSKFAGVWILKALNLTPSIQPSYYFCEGHSSPIPTQQVVFLTKFNDFLKQVRWSFVKSYDIET